MRNYIRSESRIQHYATSMHSLLREGWFVLTVVLVDISFTANLIILVHMHSCCLVTFSFLIFRLSTTRNTRICSGTERNRHVYLSRGHNLEIRVMPKKNEDVSIQFMLRYEGKKYLLKRHFEITLCVLNWSIIFHILRNNCYTFLSISVLIKTPSFLNTVNSMYI